MPYIILILKGILYTPYNAGNIPS
ncbi:uncharacterized protein FFMR_03276 [Fusarium fujikuroi]|nr:uncharacterized protein FFMR_03276 [Fusarium fujikuroi]